MMAPNSQAQVKSERISASDELKQFEDSVIRIIGEMKATTSVEDRLLLNDPLMKLVGQALQLDSAEHYSFENWAPISVVRSTNERLLLISWELQSPNGHYLHFGYAMYISKDENRIEALIDTSRGSSPTEYARLPVQSWYGAQYYEILHLSDQPDPTYVLLGKNSHSSLSTQKIVEILVIEEDRFVFGSGVIMDEVGKPKKMRRIFEFSKETDMSLSYDVEMNAIVYDHLSPSHPSYKGQFENYVPDLSFDAYVLKRGELIYKPDVDAKLHRSLKDRYFEMELRKEEKIY